MNNFKNFIVALAVLLAPAGLYAGAMALNADGWTSTTVTASSQTIFTGPGKFKLISNSTGNGANYSIALDTQPLNGLTGDLVPFSAATRLCPALQFSSIPVVGANSGAGTNRWNAGENDFVAVSTGLVIFKSAAASGEANVTTVLWSR